MKDELRACSKALIQAAFEFRKLGKRDALSIIQYQGTRAQIAKAHGFSIIDVVDLCIQEIDKMGGAVVKDGRRLSGREWVKHNGIDGSLRVPGNTCGRVSRDHRKVCNVCCRLCDGGAVPNGRHRAIIGVGLKAHEETHVGRNLDCE